MRPGPAVLGVLACLQLATVVGAQVPIGGFVACENCTAVAFLPEGNLVAFKHPRGDFLAAQDVLFDMRQSGGANAGGASAPSSTDPQWRVPPNWTSPQVGTDLHLVIVVDRGLITFDSGTITNQDFEATLIQPLCSIDGALAPRVVGGARARAVQWNPVIEQNDVEIATGCTVGAPAGRGFIRGYNVYRLDVAAHPAPSLRDFLVAGYIGHADLSRLDFDVPDPDGASGSDLDPADPLTLINPDGLPDTGDEVLTFADDGAGSGPAWYRVQPVLHGDQLMYGRIRGASRRDLDGDGTLESIDLGSDGFVEFIDPSGTGLGLTHGGEIASSYEPGLGMPSPARLGCDGRPVAPGETDCGNGVDDDGDGAIDCADDECQFDPRCGDEDCDDGVDNDGDGDVDCLDADCATDPDCVAEDCDDWRDNDGDGDVDCLDADCCGEPACLALPPEVLRLDVAKVGIGSPSLELAWAYIPPAGGIPTFDVLAGSLSRPGPQPWTPGCLWSDRSIVAGTCLSDDLDRHTLVFVSPSVPTIAARYYLVRQQGTCGVAGIYGTDSFGNVSVPGAGDCSR